MSLKDIRWRQRFTNFEKAVGALERTIQIDPLSEAERGGLIQFFEVAFELAWKTMKDYLEADGFDVRSPRDTLKQAFQNGLVKEGHQWLEALEHRNLTAHTYDEAASIAVEKLIRERYFPIIKALCQKLQQEVQ